MTFLEFIEAMGVPLTPWQKDMARALGDPKGPGPSISFISPRSQGKKFLVKAFEQYQAGLTTGRNLNGS